MPNAMLTDMTNREPNASDAGNEAEHRCQACGRKLTVTLGPYGPACARKIRQAVASVTAGTPAQRDDAAELIEDGGIVPVRETARNGTLYQTVSSDGSEVYLTTVSGCNCPSGLRGKHRCYHMLAARILRAATARAATAKRSDYAKAA